MVVACSGKVAIIPSSSAPPAEHPAFPDTTRSTTTSPRRSAKISAFRHHSAGVDRVRDGQHRHTWDSHRAARHRPASLGISQVHSFCEQNHQVCAAVHSGDRRRPLTQLGYSVPPDREVMRALIERARPIAERVVAKRSREATMRRLKPPLYGRPYASEPAPVRLKPDTTSESRGSWSRRRRLRALLLPRAASFLRDLRCPPGSFRSTPRGRRSSIRGRGAAAHLRHARVNDSGAREGRAWARPSAVRCSGLLGLVSPRGVS